jgi:CubicO group peptidase (beta-lactamase class C family)
MKQIVLAGIVLFISLQCMAQKEKTLQQKINLWADSVAQKNNLPGIGIAYLKAGKMNFLNTGFANKEQKKLFGPNTQFEIGSITKTFTAYILQKILSEKNISDAAKLIDYLPDSVSLNKALHNITILQLLNHTAGFERIPNNMLLNTDPYSNYTKAKLFSYLMTCKVDTALKYNYSNTGLALAGIIAEKLSGKSYKELLDAYIINQFGMSVSKNAVLTQTRAVGYMNGDKMNYWNWDCMLPCGGLKLTIWQTLQYLNSIMTSTNKEQQMVLNEILKPTANISKQLKIGKAWHMLEKPAYTFYWHNGGTYGFSTFCGFNKANNTAVVIVINEFSKNLQADALGLKILQALAQ